MSKRRAKPQSKSAQSNVPVWMIVVPVSFVVLGIAYVVISEVIRGRPTAAMPNPQPLPVVTPAVVSPAEPVWNWHKDKGGLFEVEMPGAVEYDDSTMTYVVSRHINSKQVTPVALGVSLSMSRSGPELTDDERWQRTRDFLRDLHRTESSTEIVHHGRKCLESFAVINRSGNRVRYRHFSLNGMGLSLMAITSESSFDLRSADLDRFFNSIKFPE